MKNTQVIQLMSIVRLSIFMLGITMMSCNSKKEQQLPAIGKSVALFDYFSYKGNDDFYISNPLSGEDYFYNPILPGWYSDLIHRRLIIIVLLQVQVTTGQCQNCPTKEKSLI